MSIQWFPGHMHQTTRQIEEMMPRIDVVIELLDARLPISSQNPLIDQLRGNTPCLKVLNKRDLADIETTGQWVDWFNSQVDVQAVAVDAKHRPDVRKIPKICRRLNPLRGLSEKPVRTMIVGIPNVGKSTLLNTLMGRKVARVGNEPAVTRTQQKVKMDDGMDLCDTPGILWHKFDDEAAGYRLAASGAIKDTAFDYEMVALFTGKYLIKHYGEMLKRRYKLDVLPETVDELIQMIGKKRGCLLSGGIVDTYRVSELLIREMRDGRIGLISFEQPGDYELDACDGDVDLELDF